MLDGAKVESENFHGGWPLGLRLAIGTLCVVFAETITRQSRKIVLQCLPPQTQDFHGFFISYKPCTQ